MQEALAACRRWKATLVIAKLDRLSRDAHFLTGLHKAGVKFVAVDMPEANEMVVTIMAAVAQAERRMISERTSTTLADLFTPSLFADLSSAVGTSLRSRSNDELEDGVAYGRQARLRRWTFDSFFSAPLVRDDGVGGMRRRSWS